MESPKRDENVASTAISPHEKKSPFSRFLNNLSPIKLSRTRESLCTQRLNESSFPTSPPVFNSPHPRDDIGGSSSNPRGQFFSSSNSAIEPRDTSEVIGEYRAAVSMVNRGEPLANDSEVIGEYRAADPMVNRGEPLANDNTNDASHMLSLDEISDDEKIDRMLKVPTENIWNHVESNEFMQHYHVGQGSGSNAGFLGPNSVMIPIGNGANQAMSTQFPSHVMQLNNDLCFNHLRIPCQQFAGTLEELSKSQDYSNRKRNRETCSDDSDGCKLCNCKKTKCLKLYCECFAAGIYCENGCACEDCLNKPDYEDTVQDVRQQIEQRNPLAFAPRIVNPHNDSPNVTATGDGSSTNSSSARHKKGCKCKKTKCLKKYCECYRAKVGCSDACHCADCDNSFGKKPELMFQRMESRKNQPHEMPNTGEVRSGSTNVGIANQFSPTWENLTDVNHLTASTNPCSRAVTSSTSYTMSDCQNVSRDWYSSALCPTQQFHGKVSGELHSTEDIPEFIMEDSNTKKSGSPNQKRISPPKVPPFVFGSNFPPGQPTARKLVMHEAESSCFPTTPTGRNSEDCANQAENYHQGYNHDQ